MPFGLKLACTIAGLCLSFTLPQQIKNLVTRKDVAGCGIQAAVCIALVFVPWAM